ncbi:MAG TPA: DUF4411 family protein [Planctomycetaceae bacterium]|nr:DUF4411 family protein [Planctomycetaceae bacterium]
MRQWVSEAERKKRLFRATTSRLLGMARQIVHEFPGLVDYDRPVPQADPFVVALALSEGKGQLKYDKCIVVTEEKFTPSGRPRIPHACEARGLQYLTIHQTILKLRAEEEWTL